MTDSDPRAALDAAIRARGEDYASLSRMLGRNSAYIQQYIKRGTPRRLGEEERRKLAAYLGVPEVELGGPTERSATAAPAEAATRGGAEFDMILVPRLAIGASAGPGAIAGEERIRDRMPFPAPWLRQVGSSPAALSVIRVEGDSMLPTLGNGDDILVDAGDAAGRLRDGIYVLRLDEALQVKRLALRPDGGIDVLSDNRQYRDWLNIAADRIGIVGRVLWVGRRL
ncbi:phage repressor protein C with HTH and peptisase S24 domain [Sphingomonas zeicaulis]|uniref:S24 family peptidase n=1 Tax=Sphingomonas zeicaulis TaxID=1632740 RepID=UPI003D1A4DE0